METEELEKELLEELNIEIEQLVQEGSAKKHLSGIRHVNVSHRHRVKQYGSISDDLNEKELTLLANIALRYFDNRCALSGEKFVMFDKPITMGENGAIILSNLSRI